MKLLKRVVTEEFFEETDEGASLGDENDGELADVCRREPSTSTVTATATASSSRECEPAKGDRSDAHDEVDDETPAVSHAPRERAVPVAPRYSRGR